MSRTAADIIEIGRDLIAVKEALPHGDFMRWLEAEFGMAGRTARRFMQSAERFKLATVANLTPSVLYALAEPSTPDEVIAEAVDRVDSGETLTAATIKQMKAEWAEERKLLKRQIDNAKADVKHSRAAATDHGRTLAEIRAENQRLRDEQHTLKVELELARKPRGVAPKPFSFRILWMVIEERRVPCRDSIASRRLQP